MPETILYDRLPKSLYGGAFELWVAPLGRTYEFGRPCGYYFHDHTWHATLDHILGWSREVIHTIKSQAWTKRVWAGVKPDWLCGHGFQYHVPDKAYWMSPFRRMIPEALLIDYAQETVAYLERCGVKRDQWGCTEHGHFLPAIERHLRLGANSKNGFIQLNIERHGVLDTYIRHQNHANAIWHPHYPIPGARNAFGIGQTYVNGIWNAMFENTAITGAATIFCFLHSANPSDTSMGTVAAYTGFASQSITCNSTNFPAASAGSITYGLAITFPTNTGSAETETAVSFAAASSGNAQPNVWGTLAQNTTVGTGTAPRFSASALKVSGV